MTANGDKKRFSRSEKGLLFAFADRLNINEQSRKKHIKKMLEQN